MKQIEKLEPPHTVYNADQAVEVARIWIVDHGQHVSISSNLFKEPAAWGLMLVDLAKHVANAYAQQGWDRTEVLKSILHGFEIERDFPTDEPRPL